MLKSKILWVNIIPVILEILHLFDVQFLSAMGLPQEWQVKSIALIALTTSVLTIIFRFGNNKPLTVIVVLLLMTGLPGCSVYNEFVKHCRPDGTVDVNSSSFKVCLQCDSVATGIKSLTQKNLKQ